MPPRSPTLTVMIKAAEKASRGLKRDFGEIENLQVSKKGPGDFVSVADKKAEETIQAELAKARPDYAFFGEESGLQGDAKAYDRFIVDPLDGTFNFLRGIPHWAISIAHESGGEIVNALVFDPIKDEMFFAEKGGGAWLNSRRLRVPPRKRLEDGLCLFGAGNNTAADIASWSHASKQLTENGCQLRQLGSGALDICYVAAGRADCQFEPTLMPWDFAAARLLVTEAGGMITRMDGSKLTQDKGSVLSSNGALHRQLVEAVALESSAKAKKVAV